VTTMSSPKTPIRNRNWKEYNNALVSRAELFFDPKILKDWEKELRRMNKRKNGRRFEYPENFIKSIVLLGTYFGFTYRKTEELVKVFKMFMPSLKKPDHSTIHRRMLGMDLNLGDSIRHRKGLIVSIDSSGLKVHNRGEWIRHKHKVRRGYLKIHFAVNTKTREIVELESTKEEVGDNRRFRPIVRKMLKKYRLKKVLADAAYDDHRNFNLLDSKKIIPAIKTKRNSREFKWWKTYDRKHRVRRKYAALLMTDYEKWKRKVGYGKRWISEIVFSSFKANFGESFASKKMENIEKEILRKAYVHNAMMNSMKN